MDRDRERDRETSFVLKASVEAFNEPLMCTHYLMTNENKY